MRYNPYRDCTEYYEWPNPWEIKPWFSEPPKKRKKPKVLREWLEQDNTNPPEKGKWEIKQQTIPYWRDIERPNQDIKESHIRFRKWPKHRRVKCEEALLPPHLCHGLRYIKITMGFPLAWRYRDMPISLNEVRAIQKKDAEERKKARLAKKAGKKNAKKAKLEAKLKAKLDKKKKGY